MQSQWQGLAHRRFFVGLWSKAIRCVVSNMFNKSQGIIKDIFNNEERHIFRNVCGKISLHTIGRLKKKLLDGF